MAFVFPFRRNASLKLEVTAAIARAGQRGVWRLRASTRGRVPAFHVQDPSQYGSERRGLTSVRWIYPRPPMIAKTLRLNYPVMARLAGSQVARFLFYAALCGGLGYLYVARAGSIPYGVFCDEAEIGIRALQVMHGNLSGLLNPFFYKHFDYILGTLPVYTTAPFVALFGLNDFGVRVSSVAFALGSLILIDWTLRCLRARYIPLTIALLALTPMYFHIARINYGSLPSYFFLLLGYLLYLYACTRDRPVLAALGGLCIGFAGYGQGDWMLASPLFMGILVLTCAGVNRLRFNCYRHICAAVLAFSLAYIPAVYMLLTNGNFLHRLHDKAAGDYAFFSMAWFVNLLRNYPKYFAPDFLFLKGETGLPNAFVTRHSVPGNGTLLLSAGVLLVCGCLCLLLARRGRYWAYYSPFFWLLLLYPLPDIITTKIGQPPYTIAAFTTLAVALPFVVSYALTTLGEATRIPNVRRGQLVVLLFCVMCLEGLLFYHNYLRLPLSTAGYWGWQSGPEQMADYFIDHSHQYDAFYLENVFNEPATLLDFYIRDPGLRAHAYVGGTENYNPHKRQLFGVSRQVFREEASVYNFHVVDVVKYPDQEAAFYLVEMGGPPGVYTAQVGTAPGGG